MGRSTDGPAAVTADQQAAVEEMLRRTDLTPRVRERLEMVKEAQRGYGSRFGKLPREERLKDALQTLEHGIDSILDSEGFASFLQTLSRFHSYSFGNVLLIRAQRPEATRVADYRK